MTGPRIFVCYKDEVEGDRLFAQQLIDDLRNAGNEIAILEGIEKDTSDEQFHDILQQTLATCEWVILVLTPEVLQSPRIAMVVNVALTLVMQRKVRGLFAMLATSVEQQDMPPTWTTIRKFDATQDYPRALARLLLTLQASSATSISQVPPISLHPEISMESQPTQPLQFLDGKPLQLANRKTPLPLLNLTAAPQDFQRWFVPLTILFILILIFSLLYSIHVFSAQSVSPSPTPIVLTTPTLTAIRTPNATATAKAVFASPRLLYAQTIQSNPLWSDPLQNTTLNNWMIGTTSNGGCAFVNGAYDVTSLRLNIRQTCLIQDKTFHNIAFQAQMSFATPDNTGSPCGLIVRMQKVSTASFRFNLYANGHYELIGAGLGNGKTNMLGTGNVAFSPHQTITLAVFAKNSQFYVYANGKYITSATDPTYSKGKIGFVCRDKGAPVKAVFSNAKLWYI
jgi:hypothetical protein